MLVRLAIEPESLTTVAGTTGQALVVHHRAISFALKHAVLIYDGDKLNASSLMQVMQKLPLPIRKRWQTAQKRIRFVAGQKVGMVSQK